MSQRYDGTTSMKSTHTGRPGPRALRSAGLVASGLIALLLLPPGHPLEPVPTVSAQSTFNYAEALQKAIFFYEAQIAGPKPPWSRVSWRGNSAMDDGDDVGRDLTGGWFDAGDHVKFGFAMASSATMLAWGGVEYRAAFESKGQLPHLLNNLRLVNDYFIKAHPSANELWGHVGDAGPDHAFWGSAEVMHLKTVRPSFRISLDGCNDGSDLAAETAAAMAASSIVFRPTDPAYANVLVSHARQLFSFAQAIHPSFYVDCMPGAPYYNSRDGGPTGPNDEMAWAAVWLHRATGEAAFLTQARQLYATMCKESQSTTPCFTWTQSWNDKHFGTYVLMAKLTGETQFHADAQRWLDHWSVGAGNRTDGGLMFVHSFGSLRYATNTAFIGLIYADLLTPTNSLYGRYHDFAKRQVDYVLGANPRNSSYMCGFGTNPPRNPHHRTAHGTWLNNPTGEPNPSRHILYGAMVAGPNADNDFAWTDSRNEFTNTEPATDMNAGLTGALARLAQEFGGNPLPNFPVLETPGDEISVDAQINVQGTTFTEIRSFLNNQSAWPARVLDQGSFRYYFTLEPGVTPGQLQINTNFNQCGSGNVTGPTLFSGSTYFVTVSCAGAPIYPGGQSEFRREVQFRIGCPNPPGTCTWNPANDYSFQGLTSTGLLRTRNIVAFDGGQRVWGDEPGPGTPDFALSASPAAVGVTQGSTATSTIAITRTGFTASVDLSASGLPTGVTAAFSPDPTTGNSSVVTFTAAAGATVGGPVNVTISGTGGTPALTRTTTIALTVSSSSNFTLSATPAAVSVTQGSTATSTIAITRTSFTASVDLSATGLPTGVTAVFSPDPTTANSSVVTFTAAATATTGGPVNVTISGTGGTPPLTRTTTIALTVNPASNFTLSATPSSVSVTQGATATSTIAITRTSFTASVDLSATGLPTGVTAVFSPDPTTGNSSVVTFTAAATATTGGPVNVTISGTGGTPALTRTTTVALTVNPSSNFTLSASPAAVSVTQGATATSTIAITRTGFTASVDLSASGLPTGVTAGFSPDPTTGNSSILTFTAAATAPTTSAPVNVTITGVGGTPAVTRTTTVALTVTGGGNGGVTVTASTGGNAPWYNENRLTFGNTASLTSVTVTIVVQRTPGITFNGLYNTTGDFTQTNTGNTNPATITYTWTRTVPLPAGSGRLFVAQTNGNAPHPFTGDTWTVTYTTGGQTFTQTGTF
jgi:endoglucanase